MRIDDGSAEQWRLADEEVRKNLPPGVKLVRTLRGHTGYIGRIAWSPDGRVLASPSKDRTIRLWDVETGECLCILEGHQDGVTCVSFDPEDLHSRQRKWGQKGQAMGAIQRQITSHSRRTYILGQ